MYKCECVRPVEASVCVPVMPRGHPPHWLTESGHLATTCHLNLLRLLWWYLTQRCPCHYCWKKTEVKNGVCSTLIEWIMWAASLLFCITSHFIVQIQENLRLNSLEMTRLMSSVQCNPMTRLSNLYGDYWMLWRCVISLHVYHLFFIYSNDPCCCRVSDL